MAVTPEQLAKSGSESAEQKALFCMAALNVGKYPELKWFHHIPNGGARGNDKEAIELLGKQHDKQLRQIRGGQLKAEGVKDGVSDTFLPVKRSCYSGLYVELKRRDLKPKRAGSKGGVSDEQLEFGEFVKSQGFYFFIAYGWEEAWACLTWYLNLT